MEDAAEDPVRGCTDGDREVYDPGSTFRQEMWEAVLDFLSTTDVGRLVPPLEQGDGGSRASDW